MLKKLSIAIIAINLIANPAMAQQSKPEPQRKEFCHAIIGLDDAAIIVAVTSLALHIGITYLQNWGRAIEIKKLKDRCGIKQ